jgi:hypothetical protein
MKSKELSKEENKQQFVIKDVVSCFDIDTKKPKIGEQILYEGNHGFIDGIYDFYKGGIGWVLLPKGGKDCFSKWKQK